MEMPPFPMTDAVDIFLVVCCGFCWLLCFVAPLEALDLQLSCLDLTCRHKMSMEYFSASCENRSSWLM